MSISKLSRKERRKLQYVRPANAAQAQPVEPLQVVSAASAPQSQKGPESSYSPEQFNALMLELGARVGRESNNSSSPALRGEAPFATPLNPSPTAQHESRTPVQAPDVPRSGGPTSEAGKLRASQNSFKHGLAAGFFHFKFIAGEDPAEYAELFSEVRAQFRPGTRAESHKIEDMAQAWWLQRRARNMQTSALESSDDKAFALYLRYETTQRRSYQAAYQDFKDMQKHRLAIAASTDPTRISQPGSFQSRPEYASAQCPPQMVAPPSTETEAPTESPLAA